MRQKIRSHLPAFAPQAFSPQAFSPQAAAPQAAATDGLSIATVRGWRLREPSSGRRHTVLRLATGGGLVGYGEGAPATAADIAEAKAAAVGRRRPSRTCWRPTDYEIHIRGVGHR